jgi:hypothetical protein
MPQFVGGRALQRPVRSVAMPRWLLRVVPAEGAVGWAPSCFDGAGSAGIVVGSRGFRRRVGFVRGRAGRAWATPGCSAVCAAARRRALSRGWEIRPIGGVRVRGTRRAGARRCRSRGRRVLRFEEVVDFEEHADGVVAGPEATPVDCADGVVSHAAEVGLDGVAVEQVRVALVTEVGVLCAVVDPGPGCAVRACLTFGAITPQVRPSAIRCFGE